VSAGQTRVSNSTDPHRISRLYYGPRATGFLLAFAASVFVFLDGVLSWWWLPACVLLFLVYPHLVYLYSRASRDPKRTELQALVFDAFAVGAWVAIAAFNLGLGFSLLIGVCLNNAVNRGLRGATAAFVVFGTGSGFGIILGGFRFEPLASLSATAVALIGVFIYILNVGVVFHSQNSLLVRVKDEVQRKRKVFEALASAGMSNSRGGTRDELITRSVSHLQRMLPKDSGLGVILRDANRPRTVHHTCFRRLDDDEQAWLLQHLVADEPGQVLERPQERGGVVQYRLVPIPVAPGSLEGYLILRARHLSEADDRMIALFMQQLGVALENHALTQKLVELANTDPLTGLANRARLDERLAEAVAQKSRCGDTDFTLLVADVNGLKEVNDEHGHHMGDRLIGTVASVLRRNCRDVDVVARVGGDEFVVLCPSTLVAQCEVLVQRLDSAFADCSVSGTSQGGEHVRLPVRVSMGVADSREVSAEAVFKEADRRMYACKDAYYRARVQHR
jgi:diguanylate cyclase (GGDEF)-like protein